MYCSLQLVIKTNGLLAINTTAKKYFIIILQAQYQTKYCPVATTTTQTNKKFANLIPACALS